MAMKFKRILVKVSGERFGADKGEVLDGPAIQAIAAEIKALHDDIIQVGVVIGGGNIVRGREVASDDGIEEAVAHQMGMLATVINALALQSALEQKGAHVRVMSAVSVHSVCEPYIRRRAVRHMEKGRIVIFAGGTGNPFFTTDTAGALRAIELGAEVLIKATKVDGIYDGDPAKNKTAKHYGSVSYKDVLVDDLKVMDGNAIALCREHRMPLIVCKLGEVRDALHGKAKCTRVG
jgi:uridylate kinase